MEIKWTPWRAGYIKRDEDSGDSGCPLCTEYQVGNDAERLVLRRGEHAYVLMNLYPYNPGHLMVVPRGHAAALADLDEETGAHLFVVAMRMAAAVRESGARSEGINLFLADREAAFQEVFHVHLHVLPRWIADSNFMTSVAEVRVLPETLGDSWRKLRHAWPGVIR